MYHSGSTSLYRLKRVMTPDKPVKSPVWQTDEIGILLSKMVSTPIENTELNDYLSNQTYIRGF